ncbi:MAG: helix-turn-helix domain-containing protein [Peptoniphilaceae bacterium]
MYKKKTIQTFLNAEQVADELGISKPFAYKVIRELNEELKEKGFVIIAGRISTKYFEERFYGVQKNIG